MNSFDELVKTVAKLRSPEGCPWDKEQTHKTLKRYLIEETYETLEAIDSNDPKMLMEELGDVLLQVILHAQIASEKNYFNISDVSDSINKKMIKRHPHVFSNTVVNSTEDVLKNWEIIKKEEKPHRKEILDGIPNSLPALLKAFKVSKKTAKEGFNWKEEKEIWDTFNKEVNEFKEATTLKDDSKIQDELGDLLFMVVNLARWYKTEPEEALSNSIKKFAQRYTRVKELVVNSKKNLNELSSEELNTLWEKVKKENNLE